MHKNFENLQTEQNERLFALAVAPGSYKMAPNGSHLGSADSCVFGRSSRPKQYAPRSQASCWQRRD